MITLNGTVPEMFWGLMGKPSVSKPFCMVCGRNNPLNQHHVVFRSSGELHEDEWFLKDRNGRKLKKPTLTLCGNGNASGCHGKAHDHKLFFRYVKTPLRCYWDRNGEPTKGGYGLLTGGNWEYLLLDKPIQEYFPSTYKASYADALEMEGWRRCL